MAKTVYIHFLILCLSCTFCNAQENRGVIINEVMQSNIDCIMVDGDFPDSWIELYNTTDKDIDLGGYVVSEKGEPDKGYALPNGTKISSHGHLLVYCDKENKGLHTHFRIDAGKANVYLFNGNKVIVDSLSLKAMPAANVAYGRKTDGDAEWWYELKATPGKANEGGGADIVLPNPEFSIEGGVYAKPQTVTVSIPSGVELPEGTRLYITVNGSEPTEQSRSVTSEYTFVTVNSMCIRAKLMAPGALSPRSVTKSYIIHPRTTSLPVISIVSNDDYFYGKENGILSSYVNEGTPNYMRKWRRPINIEYFDTKEGTTVFNQLGETAVSGVSTRETAQKSLKIYTNNRFGKKNFKGQFWSDKEDVVKVKSFVLRNGGNNCFLSRINDALVQKLFGTSIDNLDWQAYQPVIVYLNGTYLGEYGMRERSDNNYVESNYDGLEDIELADETSYQTPVEGSLFASFREDYMRKDVTYEDIAKQIDVDNFLKSLIAEIYGQNTDYPTNNVSMWRPLSEDGRWRWILKDMDRFGVLSVMNPESFDMINYIFNPDPLQYGGLHHFDLYKKMIRFNEFRDLFIDHMAVYLGDFLKPASVLALMDKMDNEIADELPATFSTYMMNYNSFVSANRNMKKIIQGRNDYLYHQMATFFNLGGVVSSMVETGGIGVKINGIALHADVFEGAFFTGKTITLNTCSSDFGWKLTILHQDGTQEVHEYAQPEISLMLSEFQRNQYETLRAEFVPIAISTSSLNTATKELGRGVEYNIDGTVRRSGTMSGIGITNRRKIVKKYD